MQHARQNDRTAAIWHPHFGCTDKQQPCHYKDSVNIHGLKRAMLVCEIENVLGTTHVCNTWALCGLPQQSLKLHRHTVYLIDLSAWHVAIANSQPA